MHFKRFAGFAAIPALSMMSTLLLLPLISSRFGADGWTSVALGQSIGAILGVFVGLGWPVVGSHMVAAGGPSERQIIFAESLKTRVYALLITSPIGVALCYFLAGSHVETAILFVVAISLNGLTAAWYFAGAGEPGKLLRNEALVRVAGYGISILLISLGAGLWSYGLCTLVAGVVMSIMNYGSILGWRRSAVWRRTRSLRTLARDHIIGGMSRFVASSSMYSGTIIVAWIAPAALPLYSAIDQVQKSVVNATNSFPQAMLSWVGSSKNRTTLLSRVKTSYRIAVLIGVVLFSAWSVLGVWIVEKLFSGKVDVPITLNLLSAALIATIALSQAVASLVLVPLGIHRVVYSATVAAALIGIAGRIVGTYFFESSGAIGGVLISYVLLLAIYAVAYRRRRRVLLQSPDGEEDLMAAR